MILRCTLSERRKQDPDWYNASLQTMQPNMEEKHWALLKWSLDQLVRRLPYVQLVRDTENNTALHQWVLGVTLWKDWHSTWQRYVFRHQNDHWFNPATVFSPEKKGWPCHHGQDRETESLDRTLYSEFYAGKSRASADTLICQYGSTYMLNLI